MSDLKNCPFCGCDKIAVSSALNYGRAIYKFHCWKCGAVSGCSETKEGAVRLWNRRTTKDALQAEIERLKKLLREVAKCAEYGLTVGIDFIGASLDGMTGGEIEHRDMLKCRKAIRSVLKKVNRDQFNQEVRKIKEQSK